MHRLLLCKVLRDKLMNIIYLFQSYNVSKILFIGKKLGMEKTIYFLIISALFIKMNKCECFNDAAKLCHYEYEQILLNKLFTDYNPQLRPNDTVQVKIALNLIQIIDIIEKDQIMVLNAFIDHIWTDSRLSWSIFCLLIIYFFYL
jgi:hypothetical protein